MRLVIKRWYEPPTPGDQYPSPYRARAILELTEEEKSLIEKYKLGNQVLMSAKYSRTTLDDVIRGHDEFQSNVDTTMGNEKVLRNACASLPELLEYCRSFGSSEITIDY